MLQAIFYQYSILVAADPVGLISSANGICLNEAHRMQGHDNVTILLQNE